MTKCLQCSKPAVLHITEIRQNQAQIIHLCESCAQTYLGGGGGEPEQSMVPEDELAAKISQLADGDDLEETDHLSCPNCGISFNEFRARGRLSCPQCYEAFGDELLSLLENIHGETHHTGKCPQRGARSSQKHYELIKLRNELRTAVEEEDYESAARLRDDIQALEECLAGRSEEESSEDAAAENP